MLESDAFPVVFFMLSYYTFAIGLLYILARSWQKALYPQTEGICAKASELNLTNYPHDVSSTASRTPNGKPILPARDTTKAP